MLHWTVYPAVHIRQAMMLVSCVVFLALSVVMFFIIDQVEPALVTSLSLFCVSFVFGFFGVKQVIDRIGVKKNAVYFLKHEGMDHVYIFCAYNDSLKKLAQQTAMEVANNGFPVDIYNKIGNDASMIKSNRVCVVKFKKPGDIVQSVTRKKLRGKAMYDSVECALYRDMSISSSLVYHEVAHWLLFDVCKKENHHFYMRKKGINKLRV